MIKKNPQYPILIAERSVAKKPLFIFLCAMLLGSLPCFSTTYYSKATGNWNAPATWSTSIGGPASAVVPGAGDDVSIMTGMTVNLTTNQSITNVTINGGTLNLNTATRTLTVSGNFTMTNTSAITGGGTDRIINVSGNFNVNAPASATINNIYLNVTGTITNATSATVTLIAIGGLTTQAPKKFGHYINNGTWTNNNIDITINGNFVNNGTFNAGTGRVIFNGATSNTITGSASGTAGITPFNEIEVNKGLSTTGSPIADKLADQAYVLEVQTNITISNGKLFLQKGTFKLSSTSSIIVPFSATNYSIPTAARLWNNGGTINSSSSFSNWYIGGTFENSDGTCTIGDANDEKITPDSLLGTCAIIISGGAVDVAGRISHKNAQWSYTMSGGVLTLSIVGNTSSTRDPFNMDNSLSSFTMTGGKIIIVNANNGAGSENLGYRNISTLGGGFTGGTLQIGTAATATATGKMRIETTRPIYNLEVVGANTTALIASPASPYTTTSVTITNDVTITSGVLDIGTNNQDLIVGGNWTNTSTILDPFIEDTEKVTFNGTSGTQTIASTGTGPGAINGTTFYDLTINNTSPTVPQITTTADVAVTHTLTMLQGKVNLSLKTLKLGTGTTSTLKGTLSFPPFSNSTQPATWLYGGTFTRYFQTGGTALAPNSSDAAGLFPMGSETDYHPFWLSYSTALATGGTFSVNHTPSNSGSVAISPNYTDPSCTSLTIVGISNASWLLSNTITSSTLGIRYGGFGFATFVAADLNASLASSTVGSCGGTSNVIAGTYFEVNRIALSNSDINNRNWYIGTTDLILSPLPIELLSFEAYLVDTTVNLKWSTATETNCDYFLVERLIDGYDWKAIAQVNGNGTTTQEHVYTTTDPTAPFGNNYYRLKEVDYNGESEIFPIQSIYKPFRNRDVSIYFNAMGQQIVDLNNYSGLFFIQYKDGTIEKRIKN